MNKTGKNDGIMSDLIGNIHNQNDGDKIHQGGLLQFPSDPASKTF